MTEVRDQRSVGNEGRVMTMTMTEVDAHYEGLLREIKELQEMLEHKGQRSEIRGQTIE